VNRAGLGPGPRLPRAAKKLIGYAQRNLGGALLQRLEHLAFERFVAHLVEWIRERSSACLRLHRLTPPDDALDAARAWIGLVGTSGINCPLGSVGNRVRLCITLSDVTTPFSLRMDDDTRKQLLARAEKLDLSASQLANRYVKEGLRMDEHSGIMFASTPLGRRAVLASRPRIQVLDLIGTWLDERQDVAETARYFDVSEDDVRAAVRYYASFKDELDGAIRQHREAQANFEQVLARRNKRARRATA